MRLSFVVTPTIIHTPSEEKQRDDLNNSSSSAPTPNVLNVPDNESSSTRAPVETYGNKRFRLFGRKFGQMPFTKNRKTQVGIVKLGGTITAKGDADTYTAGELTADELVMSMNAAKGKKVRNMHFISIPLDDIDSSQNTPAKVIAWRNEALRLLEKHDTLIFLHGSDSVNYTSYFFRLDIP